MNPVGMVAIHSDQAFHAEVDVAGSAEQEQQEIQGQHPGERTAFTHVGLEHVIDLETLPEHRTGRSARGRRCG
jgi:hypothetical protein